MSMHGVSERVLHSLYLNGIIDYTKSCTVMGLLAEFSEL